MNSRLNEDLAWQRVQDMQREAENRRLMMGSLSSSAISALGRLIVRTLTRFRPQEAATRSVARPTVESQHHA
jgi:hypothetical protein